jgi:YhcH/YjgK/YiaL family protein
MVLDKIENAELYNSLGNSFTKALEFLKSSDFSKMENGKYELDGEDIFALLNEYETQLPENCKLEGHKKYIDVQFMVSGTEAFGYVHFTGQKPKEEYDQEKDRAFYHTEVSMIKFEERSFAIFWPEDLHMPGAIWQKPEKIKKVVVKIKI